MSTPIPPGYPPDYAVILRDLLTACKHKRIYVSSSHSPCKNPGYRMAMCDRVCVDVNGMEILITDRGVHCFTHQIRSFKTIGCSLGDGGVWLSISEPTSEFWMEIHVPTLSNRDMQARSHGA
jgi:hypothetical protein